MAQRGTRTTFGFKWSTWPEAGHRTDRTGAENRIRRNGWTVPEFESWVEDKVVLDAGSGSGWWVHYLEDAVESGRVVGVEIADDAVRTGYDSAGGELLHGDITNLPFDDETFDYVSCEAVLHHTPDPPATLEHLVDKLVPGGEISLYVYKEKPLIRELADTAIRERTTDLDVDDCVALSENMAELGRELSRIDEEITVPEIPELDVEAGTYDVHEFVYRYFVKCFFDWEHEDWETSVATNFDWYHPEYAYRFSESELREVVADVDLEIAHFNEQMSGFSVWACKREDH